MKFFETMHKIKVFFLNIVSLLIRVNSRRKDKRASESVIKHVSANYETRKEALSLFIELTHSIILPNNEYVKQFVKQWIMSNNSFNSVFCKIF